MNNSSAMRGGAIILVVLIMISLSVFGVLAIVSAHSNFIMAQKGAVWVQRYYELDAMGQRELASARDIVAEDGFSALEMQGWTVEGELASLELTLEETFVAVAKTQLRQGEQSLRIVLQDVGGSLHVVQWIQIPEDFEYVSEENNVWQGDFDW